METPPILSIDDTGGEPPVAKTFYGCAAVLATDAVGIPYLFGVVTIHTLSVSQGSQSLTGLRCLWYAG